MMLNEILRGAMVSGALIVAIGAQNLFVLKQGLLRNHIFSVCVICFVCDLLLMSAGVLGVGGLIMQSPLATRLLALFGAAFLVVYGARSLISAVRGTSVMALESGQHQRRSLTRVIMMTLAVTLLNPHVYLDTVVIVGGIAATLSLSEKVHFLLGAAGISALWFFGLGFGARLLSPLFQRQGMWVILDSVVGVLMLFIAFQLIRFCI